MEVILLCWVLIMASLWLIRLLAEEAWAAVRGQTSPRLQRRRDREDTTRRYGTPTVGQAIGFRLARRIAHPPDRRWARTVRAFLVELVEDAVAEARIRHHVNQRRRARRQQPWQARTGRPSAPPPPPEPDDDVLDMQPCTGGCGTQVAAPDEVCDACDTTGPARNDEPTPEPQTEPEPTDRKDTPMTDSATHIINGDVRDPRTALAFATSCRGFNDGIVGELEVLANNMTQAGVGPGPLGQIRVLADAARAYSGSNRKSVQVYAQHVVTQADIAGDEDLRNTVRRTYLDTRGGDAAPTQMSGGGSTRTISAADCTTPAAGSRLMDAIAGAYAALQASVDQAKGNHQQQCVSGEPIRFFAEQLDLATGLTQKATDAARTFRNHVKRRDDTVAKDSSLHGTQRGRYLDPARA